MEEQITEVGAPSSLFTITVLVVVANGLADALAQGSLFGIASNMPPRYTQALVSKCFSPSLSLSLSLSLCVVLVPSILLKLFDQAFKNVSPSRLVE